MSSTDPVYNRRGLGLLIALGVVFAAAFTLLSVYGPDFQSGSNGGAHALSPAATGYSAIVKLSSAAGLPATLGRTEQAAQAAGLLVLTPEAGTASGEIRSLVRKRRGAPTLIILPKWQTAPLALHPGWVQSTGQLPLGAAARMGRGLRLDLVLREGVIADGAPLRDSENRGISVPAPRFTRSIAGSNGLDAVLADAAGHMVIGWKARENLYVLVEPDLLNNKGLRTLPAARAGVRLLAALGGARQGGLVFDVTLNGYAANPSLLRTAFQPPFLSLTLALLIAGALACWYGLMRFGAPQTSPRAIAFGKVALVDNAASLIRMAGREDAIAARYAALVGETVAARLHAPAGLDAAAMTGWLEARAAGYATLAHDAAAASGRDQALVAAQNLYRWRERVL